MLPIDPYWLVLISLVMKLIWSIMEYIMEYIEYKKIRYT